ncbi:GIN domain-containing protein [Williamwhitmania taraxaci]|uniref:Putative auto-transporter adhesin, head GIN domain n=1 Tax=Williamwhitmania taraxaci TaxID=1640674 RepID=A0A1G6GQT8_9BACT|nr:DUF2807 domain-containing protein [Williamwhitmania taraxaci]SDB84269.1 Putative auto-transporter adhesin, head GIN domain [Williamwhitmania taraxaci]
MVTLGKLVAVLTIICLPLMGFTSNAITGSIKGDGDLVVKNSESNPFTQLVANFAYSSEGNTENNITVVLQNTGDQKVSVYAEKNLQSYIETKTENGILYLSVRKGKKLSPTSAITIYVDASTLKHISGKGNLRLACTAPLNSESLSITFDGVLNGSLEVNVNNLQVNVTGVYEFGLFGKADNATIKTSGVGTLDHSLLVTKKLEAKINSISKKNFHSLIAQR